MSIRMDLCESNDSGSSYKYAVYSGREYVGNVRIVCHYSISDAILMATNVEGFYTGYLTMSSLDDTPKNHYGPVDKTSSELEFVILKLAETLVRGLR